MSKNSFCAFAENSADVVCRIDHDIVLRYASPSVTRVLGWLPEELIGKGPEGLVFHEDLPQVYEAARQTNAIAEGPGAPATVRMLHKKGSVVWMDISASVVPSAEADAPPDIILVMRDITGRMAVEQQLAELAITDGLTGLLNRRGFDQALEDLWQRTLAAGSQLSLLLLDADHFKAFNDHYGHQVGDDCLRTIARTILSSLERSADCAARYGGEEIAVILPGTGAEGAIEVAERIRCAVEELDLPHAGSPVHRRVTVSVGVATAVARCGGSMRMPESLVLAADNALYRAKHRGRNCVERMILLASKAS